MKMPSTVADIMDEGVIVSWHAGVRFLQRSGLVVRDKSTKGMLCVESIIISVLSDGVLFSGQRDGDISVLGEVADGNEIVFILCRAGHKWMIRTILTKFQAMANMQLRG